MVSLGLLDFKYNVYSRGLMRSSGIQEVSVGNSFVYSHLTPPGSYFLSKNTSIVKGMRSNHQIINISFLLYYEKLCTKLAAYFNKSKLYSEIGYVFLFLFLICDSTF